MGNLVAQFGSVAFTADQVLSPYVYVFYASFVVSFVFTPVMRAVAMAYNVVDNPDRARKMHLMPVAYLGGVAVFLGWLSGLAVSQFLTLHRVEAGWPVSHAHIKFSIVLGGLLIVCLGLWDDIGGVKPLGKILAQSLAAGFLLLDDVGVTCARSLIEPLVSRIHLLLNPGAPLPEMASLPWFDPVVRVASALLVLLVVVGCCNATNLMDGLDGLCGGVTAIIAFGFLFVAVHLAMNGGGLNTNWDALRVVLGLAILGAVLGFIPYNFNPASIFMGDTGSMFLGFTCAVMIILMAQEQPRWFLASMVMFALPVLDTSLAFARRWLAGRPLFSADAQHFHHQLVQRGFSVKQTVMISYGLAIFFALLGAAIVFIRTRYAVAVYLVTFGSIIVAAYKLGMVHERPLGGKPSTLKDAADGGEASEVVNSGSAFEVTGLKPGLAGAAPNGTDVRSAPETSASEVAGAAVVPASSLRMPPVA